MFNLDRTKNIIGKEVYDAIGAANQSQLEKWLSDLQHELKYFATPEDARYNKLKHEEQLIMYRLGLKMESKMKKSHPLQENYERFFGRIAEAKPKFFSKNTLSFDDSVMGALRIFDRNELVAMLDLTDEGRQYWGTLYQNLGGVYQIDSAEITYNIKKINKLIQKTLKDRFGYVYKSKK